VRLPRPWRAGSVLGALLMLAAAGLGFAGHSAQSALASSHRQVRSANAPAATATPATKTKAGSSNPNVGQPKTGGGPVPPPKTRAGSSNPNVGSASPSGSGPPPLPRTGGGTGGSGNHGGLLALLGFLSIAAGRRLYRLRRQA